MAEGGDAAAGDLGVDLCRETEDTSPIWVFWDVEECPLLKNLNLEAADVFPKIKSILGQWGYRGPVEVIAIGCAEWFSHPTATDLTNTGVTIRPFKYDDEFSHISSQVIDAIEEWIMTNSPPASILFIADRHFPGFVEDMCQHNCNVLLRQQQCRSPERKISWRERQNYCWSWVEVLEGRPEGNLKRSRDIGGPSLSEAKRLAL